MNNKIIELDTGTAAVTAITPKILSATIEEIRRGEKIWGQFFKENRDLMNNGGTEVVFPKKKSGIAVTWGISPGGSITASSMSYDATTIAIAKGGIGLAFQGEAIRQANRDIIADQIAEAGLAWRDTLDLVAMEKMFPSATVVAADSIAACVGTIVVGIKETIGNWSTASITVDAHGTTIGAAGDATAATISFWYIPTTTQKRAASSASSVGSISPKDIFRLKSDINSKLYKPDLMIMHPDMFAEVIYDPSVKFVEKSAYEGQGVVFNGEIGKLWGVKVLTSEMCPRFAIVMMQSDKVGREVVRKELDMKRDEYTGINKDLLYFWGFGERNFGVVNPYAYGAVYCIGTIATGNWEVQSGAFSAINP